jgi:hypothetical protein
MDERAERKRAAKDGGQNTPHRPQHVAGLWHASFLMELLLSILSGGCLGLRIYLLFVGTQGWIIQACSTRTWKREGGGERETESYITEHALPCVALEWKQKQHENME